MALGVSAFSTSSKHKKNKVEKFKKSYFSKIKYLPIYMDLKKIIFQEQLKEAIGTTQKR